MELVHTLGDSGLLLFSLAGLIATGAAIVRDTATQRAQHAEIVLER